MTILKIKPHELEALLRRALPLFIERCFVEVGGSGQFLHNWHVDYMAHHLERCRTGQCKRLIINLPPRNLKSICASIAFPAFLMGHNPKAQIICASYGQSLATELAGKCRNVMQSPWYQQLFPTRLDRRNLAVDNFATTRGGRRIAAGVGGPITGRGADYIIIDDPLKPDEAMSLTSRTAVNEWYDSTLYTRLNDKVNGCIIIIMQRLHEDDLVGHVLEQEGWEVVRLPAIAEEDEIISYQTVFGPKTVTRIEGSALHPEREPIALLEKIRNRMGTFNFAGQYQQLPAPAEGALVKREWFKQYYDLPKFDYIIQSWDTANKATELSDYSVCTTWGMHGKDVYLLHVFRKKLEFPELKRHAIAMQHAHNASYVLIEDRASGTQLIQELNREGIYTRSIHPENDKIMRMHAQTAMIEAGRVYLPHSADWLNEYIRELCLFPSSRHDDQVDSTSQALQWMNNVANQGDRYRISVL